MIPPIAIRVLVCLVLLAGGGPVFGQTGDPVGDARQEESADGRSTAGDPEPADSLDTVQDTTRDSADDLVGNLERSLDIIEAGLNRGQLTSEEIDGIRQQIDFIADSALRTRTRAMRRTEELSRLLDALGAKPGDTDPPEAARVEAERKRLEDALAEHRGRIKSANVVLARVDAFRIRLARAEFEVLARILGQRTETPLAPGLVAEAVAQVPDQWRLFRGEIAKWWKNVEFDRTRFVTVMWWLVLLVAVMAVVLPTRNWLLRRYGPDHREESPSFTRRFRVMLAVGLGNVVLPVVSVAGLYVVLLMSAALTDALHHGVWILMISLCQLFLITGLSAAALSPEYPSWRISRFTNDAAVLLFRRIRLYAYAVVGLNLVGIVLLEPDQSRSFSDMLVMDVTRDSLPVLFGAAAVVIIAIAMINVLRDDNWRFIVVDEDGQSSTMPPGKLVRIFFHIARVGLVLSVVAALVGYVNLGIFLSQRIVWSLLLVAFALILRAFVAAICNQAAHQEADSSSLLLDKLGYSGSGAARLMFWVMLAVDIVLSVAVIVFMLLIWGVQATDIFSTAAKLFYGVSIGEYTLSLVDIGIALGLFIVLFILVRLFQGFLSNRVLAQTVPDVGVRDALTTGVGYAGIIIAAVIAVSSLGLELSQLALIFGALSVGIGFGLQHVVNNFVSGLILLMHRPIKAGDWIVVGQHEGYVKKINVVATEIQTFDNAEVIVPNSQLVSSEVMNWTHKSTVARVIVEVGVSYDSDPKQVRDLLLRCAEKRDDVLRTPAPTVVFRDFGDSALVFQLRFFIREADYMLITGSEVRFAIIDAFRESGVTIPFPQRDIHVVTPDRAGELDEDPAETHTPAGGAGSKTRARRRPRDGMDEDVDADAD